MSEPALLRRPIFWAVAGGAPVALLVTVGIAATTTRAGAAGATPDLAGRAFAATEAHGRTLADASTVMITFEADSLSATAGCNTEFGGATWTDGVLEVSALATTMMACAPELMDQDAWLSDLLESRPTIALDGTTLTIGDTTSGLVLEATD